MGERPYERRVQEVITEELCAHGVDPRELPDKVQAALGSIVSRLANDLEFTRRHGAEIAG